MLFSSALCRLPSHWSSVEFWAMYSSILNIICKNLWSFQFQKCFFKADSLFTFTCVWKHQSWRSLRILSPNTCAYLLEDEWVAWNSLSSSLPYHVIRSSTKFKVSLRYLSTGWGLLVPLPEQFISICHTRKVLVSLSFLKFNFSPFKGIRNYLLFLTCGLLKPWQWANKTLAVNTGQIPTSVFPQFDG